MARRPPSSERPEGRLRSCRRGRGSQGVAAFFPLGRADLARVVADVLGRLDLADEFGRVAADAFASDFHDLDHAVRVDHEGGAVGKAHFTKYAEVVRQGVGLVAEEGELQLADLVGRVVPGLVAEVGVGRHTVDFDAQRLERIVLLTEIFEFGRADEREVGRIEEEHGPLAFDVLFGDVEEILARLECGVAERLDGAADDTHG